MKLIETMRLNRRGEVLLLPLHLTRLRTSAQQLGFFYDEKALQQHLAIHLHQPQPQPQRLRLTLEKNGHVEISCSTLAHTITPVWLKLQSTPINLPADSPLLLHKTTQRQHWHTGEKWLQQHPHFFDVIYADNTGLVTEGGRSNVYIWCKNRWITPPLQLGLLNGVLRRSLLQRGAVHEQCFTTEELLAAPKVRISNALRGWIDATIRPAHNPSPPAPPQSP